MSEIGRRRGERDGGYGSVGWFQVAARMRCVELVANWVIGDVGAVYDGRDSKGLAKWMKAVRGGIAILERERERCVVHRKGWLA